MPDISTCLHRTCRLKPLAAFLLLLLTVLPSLAQDFTYNGITYTVLDPEARTCETKAGTYGSSGNIYEGDLIIPEKVSDGTTEYTVVSTGYRGFANCNNLTSITLPETLTSIGACTFIGCTGLLYLNLPVSLPTIGDYVFEGCSGLKSINFPQSLISIGNSTFKDCTNLESLNFPASITSIGNNTFEGCSGLKSINFPQSLISIGNSTFKDCTSLVTLIFPTSLTSIGNSTFFTCTGLTSLSFPESLTTIGDETFECCTSLTSLIFPESLTSIGMGTFAECTGLTSLSFPESLTSIGNATFLDCTGLTSLTFPQSLKAIGDETFFGCTGITSLTFPPSLTSIGNFAFENCTGLISITLPESITTIGDGTFISCSSLTSLNFPQSLTSIGVGTFSDCISLTSLVFPESLTSIGDDAFEYCSNLISLSFPEALTSVGDYAFKSCTGLTSVYFPEALTSLGKKAFENCSGLTSVTLPKLVNSIGEAAFNRCENLEFINYEAINPTNTSDNVFDDKVYNEAILSLHNAPLNDVLATPCWNQFKHIVAKDGAIGTLGAGETFDYQGFVFTVVDSIARTCEIRGWSGDIDKQLITDLVIPERVSDRMIEYTVVSIGNNAFIVCDHLTSVTFPESLISIGDNAFHGCNGLTSLTFPISLTTIGENAFYSCRNLIALNFNEALTSIREKAFMCCDNLTTLNLPESLVSIGNDSFCMCTGLTSVTLPSSLKSLGDCAFMECSNLKSVVIPESLTSIGTAVFFACTNLTSATFPETLTTIGEAAFVSCYRLESLTFPESLKSIAKSAFVDCRALTSLTLPESLTSIGDAAFAQCTGLTSVTIPKSISTIDTSIFGGCNSLISITYGAEMPIETESNVFEDEVYEEAVLTMPNAALADVLATPSWNLFKHIEAKDGKVPEESGNMPLPGDTFYYEGISYTVLDTERMTCTTTPGLEDGTFGNHGFGDQVIPEEVSYGEYEFTVTEIGDYGFKDSMSLYSVTLPGSIERVGTEAFADCPRLTSFVWLGHRKLPEETVNPIGNPNLLIYVDSLQFAPAGFTENIVELNHDADYDEPICRKLVLAPDYPFTPVRQFISLDSRMTKEFTQATPIEGCAGWETILLPFDATSVAVDDARGQLTPFAAITDISVQYPFWLYEADSENEWRETAQIKAGVPYVISMPNNAAYDPRYRIEGPVTFSNPEPVIITPQTTDPYAVTWASGYQFRSLWLPINTEDYPFAMGLNVNIDNLTNDDGELLLPGSTFHLDVTPRPLQGFVEGDGSRMALPVIGGQSHLPLLTADNALAIMAEEGVIWIRSASDCTLSIFRIDGVCERTLPLKAGEMVRVDNLAKGIYIVAGQKVIIR